MLGLTTAQLGFAVLLIAILGTIIVIDLRELRVPDIANAALFAAAMMYWWTVDSGAIPLQIASAAGAFGLLWAVRAGHMKIALRTGLGMGDVKMVGASAAWFHPVLFPAFLAISAGSALVAALVVTRGNSEALSTYRLPFGPFLAIGLFVTWIMEVNAG